MRCSLLLTVVFLAGHLEPSSAWAAGKYDPYLRYFPESVNAFVVCEVRALYQSDLAKRERWETTQPLPGLPPQISHGLLGAKFNPGAVGADVWEVILAFPRGNVDLAKIATQENGAVDIVSGLSSVLSSRNAYFVELGPSILAVLRPANRQDLVNWIRFTRSNQKQVLSPFLRECVAGVDKDTQILMALDLTDSVSPAELRKRLARSQTVQEKKPDLDTLAKVLSSIQGVKLALHVDEQIAGELTVSFRENASALKDIGQPLLLEILAFRGAMVDGLEQWQAETAGTRLTLRGSLSTSGLRQILSLIQLPPVPSEGETPAKLTEEIRALASQRYFRTIQMLLDDLKKHDRRARNYGDTALWYEKGAQRIDRLPTLNVDADLLPYAANLAVQLLGMAASLRGEAVQLTELEQQKRLVVSVRPSYGWGWYPWYQTNIPQFAEREAEAVNQGIKARKTIWKHIDERTATMRRKMMQKYKLEF